MTEPAEQMFRVCCSAMAGAAAPPMLPANLPLTAGTPVALPARERQEADAFHEAGHVAVGLGLGWAADVVTIDDAPHVRWRAGCRPLAEIAAVALAGGIAERWHVRLILRPHDNALMAVMARVRGLAGGSCDACRAARAAIVETGHGPDVVAIARMRDLELWTIETVKGPQIWAAIRAIAAELMAEGTLNDDTVETICREFFKPGGLSVPALSEE